MTIGSTIHLLIKSPEPLTTSGSIKYKPNVAVESPKINITIILISAPKVEPVFGDT
jgi:hypothetical protein